MAFLFRWLMRAFLALVILCAARCRRWRTISPDNRFPIMTGP